MLLYTRSGDEDVLLEVRFAAFLVDLGYDPVLDEEHHGKKPDALIVSEGQEIFIDVISPHLSNEMTEAFAAMQKLAGVLLEKLSQRAINLRLDVYCFTSPNEVLDTVSCFLDHPLQPSLETVHELTGYALIKYSSRVNNPDSASVVPPDAPPPVLGVGVANQTIIDITRVPNGFKGWQPLLRRNLPPARNRRYSGVMLYRQLWNGTGRSLREWYFEQHPNPYKKLPPSFIEALRMMEKEKAGFL